MDSIEQTLKNLDGYPDSLVIGSEGYLISYAIAKENLALGLDVIADSVNPIAITRHDWRQVAKEANTVSVDQPKLSVNIMPPLFRTIKFSI